MYAKFQITSYCLPIMAYKRTDWLAGHETGSDKYIKLSTEFPSNAQ